jgi:hypothetical protein
VIAAAVLLAAVGVVYLPDTLVVKITLSGAAGKTMPKLPALAIPTLISGGFALNYLLDKKTDGGSDKSLWTSLVGILIFIIMFLVNSGAMGA